jgi:DNA helicase-2/ATP-dependent DNA helicase PcrA
MVESGLFYLRYTTGAPAVNMRSKAAEIISDYVETYAPELSKLQFDPEREFETLIEEEQVLVSGAIDVVRLDDPPRVTIIDFKSGDPESDAHEKLDEDEMRLQVSLYGLAAKHELEYEPERGLVRYLAEQDPAKRELAVDLTPGALAEARAQVAATARQIRERNFAAGPTRPARNGQGEVRCSECDFVQFCGRPEAKQYRGW